MNIKEKVASYVVLAVMYMFLLIVITLLGNCVHTKDGNIDIVREKYLDYHDYLFSCA